MPSTVYRCAMPSGTNLIITPDAETDIRDIPRYTMDHWGRSQRNAYFAELKRAARRLQAFPEMGREREDGLRLHSRPSLVVVEFISTLNLGRDKLCRYQSVPPVTTRSSNNRLSVPGSARRRGIS